MAYSFTSKNPLVASVSEGNKVTCVSEGNTIIEAFDKRTGYRGKVPVTCVRSEASYEPTAIVLDRNYVKLNTAGGDSMAWLKAKVLPDNATNKTVKWECSDPSLVQVSNSGKITAVRGTRSGTVTITAYTYNKSAYDTCTVTVTAQGTIVKGINPSVKSGVPAGGSDSSRTFSVDIDYETLNNYDSGFTTVGDYAYYSVSRPADGKTKSPLNVTVKKNYGCAREFQIIFSGNFTDDPGKTLIVRQLGSEVVNAFKYFTSGVCNRNGQFYHTNKTTFSGALHFTCAAGNVWNILNDTNEDTAIKHPSWIHVNTNKWGIESTGRYTSAQLMEYDRTGKINGKDPGFNGVVFVGWVNVTVDKNETGAARDGSITFPGGKVFPIHQDA